MKMLPRIFGSLCVLALVVTAGCAKDKSSNEGGGSAEGTLGGASYVLVDGGDLQRSANLLSGSGAVAFKEPIGALDSKKSYTLTFSIADGGKFALAAHGNEKLENAAEVRLSRAGNVLKVELGAAGQSTESKVLEGIDAAAESVTLTIDVHNDESPAHILLWSGSDFAEDKAVFNSEEDAETPGQGSGAFWGLRLQNSTVSSATIGAPKYVEEE
jgi:hypothetical protein